MQSEPIEAFWREYLTTLPPDSPDHGARYEAEAFGDSPEMADELGALVTSGTKTATCSALREYEAEGEPLPEPGAKCVVLDGRGAPLCVIETVEAEVRPYNEEDARFACNGEGDRYSTGETCTGTSLRARSQRWSRSQRRRCRWCASGFA